MNGVRNGVRGLVGQARRAALKRNQSLSTTHLGLVMVQTHGDAGTALRSLGLQESGMLTALRGGASESSSAVERAVERAAQVAKGMDANEIRPLHLLVALVRDAQCAFAKSLASLGFDAEIVHRAALTALGASDRVGVRSNVPRTHRKAQPTSSSDSGSRASVRSQADAAGPVPVEARQKPVARPVPKAKQAGLPLRPSQKTTKRAEVSAFELDAKKCPLLARWGRNLTREAEQGNLDEVFGREAELEHIEDILARRKANNPLLVGPSGVGKTSVVEALALKIAVRSVVDTPTVLVGVSVGALMSGTGVRGALSERMQQIWKEVRTASQHVVLFFDDLHAVVGGDGPDELVQELKGALAGRAVCCIGATSEAAYHRYIERDPALVRHFSVVRIGEPSAALSLQILEGSAAHYASHHRVRYDDEALRFAVELSARFVPERRLPEKALSVIDVAGARMARRGGKVVDAASVAEVVAEEARVPLQRLMMRDADVLLDLETQLRGRVVGHEDAMRRIAAHLRKGAAGFFGNRPLGTFLLLGPTGVGKTETAKAVNELFFPGASLTRIDMSEYSESHTVARLLGAPPGYVGHEDGGQLTEAVRRRPYQLVLLDEIEKAHAEVLLALLPLLDEGHLTDGRGRTVDFKNVIIMMTSNLGAGGQVSASIGFGSDQVRKASEREATLASAKRALPPEFWNRIDEPLYFSHLEREQVAEIARRMLGRVAHQVLEQHKMKLSYEPEVIEKLCSLGGYEPALGARPMARTVARFVEAPLAEVVIARCIEPGASVRLEVDGDAIQVVPVRSGSDQNAAGDAP